MLNSTDSKIALTIKSRQKTYFNGLVYAVSSVNDRGAFDILPKHANFITKVQQHILIHTTKAESQELKIKLGVMRVTADKVDVYLTVV